jgi:hypothetical protein
MCKLDRFADPSRIISHFGGCNRVYPIPTVDSDAIANAIDPNNTSDSLEHKY